MEKLNTLAKWRFVSNTIIHGGEMNVQAGIEGLDRNMMGQSHYEYLDVKRLAGGKEPWTNQRCSNPIRRLQI